MRFLTILLIIATIIKQHTSNPITNDNLKELLTGDRTSWQKLPIQYMPIISTPEDTWPYLQLTPNEIYDSTTKYPTKDSFNYLIDINNIEVIINENDAISTEQFITGFSNELNKTINVNLDRFYQLINEMGGKSNITRDDFDTDEIDINGFGSDYYYANPEEGDRASTGMNSEYHLRAKSCGNLKGCNVYSHWRVIHQSKSFNNGKIFTFSCNDIITKLLPQIYACIDKYDEAKKCPLLLTHGYFRDVWKVKVPNSNNNPFYEYVILKMMRPKKNDDIARDLQRNMRESILLYYLQKEEEEYISSYGSKFISHGIERAFPYVRELGHCIYPTYISIAPYYNLTYEKFIKSGQASNSSIKKLIKMSIDIAKGTEILHNIGGGPFHHTDIAIDQFMIDENNNVLLNDFNRGKFQTYKFNENENDKSIIKCIYCPYESDGRNRAPEELKTEALSETIDIYSTAMTIWSLFSGTRLWTKPWTINKLYNKDGIESDSSGESITYKDIKYLVHDTYRRPIMPYNMPYALKELIRYAITQNPKNRPNAKQFRKELQYIYKHLNRFTRNKADIISYIARRKKLFKDHSYPHVPHNFPRCCRSK